MENWVNPRIIIGSTATGNYYFHRPDIVSEIEEELQKGNYVLLAAPRRVGKSSIMEFMVENCNDDTKGIFRNIQGIQTESEFYQTLYQLIFGCLSKFQKSESWLKKLVGETNITKVTMEGVEFGDKKQINFLAEINRILPKLKSNHIKVILFLDELPEVLNNLYKANRIQEANGILDNLRQWRQMPEIKHHFSMVLAGSVGIHHIVKKIDGRVVDINDLSKVKIDALSHVEAKRYISWATDGASIQYNEDLKDHYLILSI